MVRMEFKLTYSTMFDPPASLHERFEAALAPGARGPRSGARALHRWRVQTAPLRSREGRSPIHRDWVLGHFPEATNAEVDEAMAAAKRAFPAWRHTPPGERNRILRRVAAAHRRARV